VLEKEAIDLVFTAGDQMAHLANALDPAMGAGHSSNTDLLQEMVLKAIQPGDVVIVKGSAGSKTGVIVQAFLDLNQKRSVNGD
jgi:UDP-N-acetylmuramoyl-tripeptide--D-alanyl-D-alanine ligase